jgi:heme oxygenase
MLVSLNERHYERLERETAAERARFMELPFVRRFLETPATRPEDASLLHQVYRRFLEQSYFHVRAAARVYALAGSRVGEQDEPLREWLLRHSVEEYGHHQWILDDLRSLGSDPDAIAARDPAPETAALVGYMYYAAGVDNPVGILGDSYVIEGLSQLFASTVARNLQRGLGLEDKSVVYLARHGEADQSHMEQFKVMLDRDVRTEEDFRAIVRVARVEFDLYGRIVALLGQDR